MMSNLKTFDTWRDTDELYARMLIAGKGRDIEPEARLVYVKMRAVEQAGWSMWRAIILTLILAAVWWFVDRSVGTYAGWGAIILALWTIFSIAFVALCVWDAQTTANKVMSQLSTESIP